MPERSSHLDALVIGSGPNGLAAAITVAQRGHSVVVYEAEPTIGGGTRSAELTAPGFVHDVCSCVHPMALSSPFFKTLNLEAFGLRWIQPPKALAHPFDSGDALSIGNPFSESAAQFGKDKHAIGELLGLLIESWNDISANVLAPLSFPTHFLSMAQFGWNALQPASRTAGKFKTSQARAVFAGMAGHSVLPLDRWASSSFGILLWVACYAVGWPFAAGGSQSIAQALAGVFKSLGGEIVTGHPVAVLGDLPKARAVLCDVTPRQFLKIAGHRMSSSARRLFENFRYGPGAFKMDWALNAPIPWMSPSCRDAGTVHIGASFEEIAQSELDAWSGKHAERPFVILAQPSLFDPARAPEGKHTAWAYCHVPHASTFDMTERIEAQIERFAPGFRQTILARSVLSPQALERHNANLVGGDIGGGAMNLAQLFTRPTRRLYSTPIPNVFLCSASTPPGPGVHGMCGHWAAKRALRQCF
jgi:phytoene dehydrogenase-like protein